MSERRIIATVSTALAFLRTRWLAQRLRTRADIAAWRQRRLGHFLQNVVPRAEAFRHLDGKPLADFPVMDKAALMGAFHRYNRYGITVEEAWQALETRAEIRGCAVGASTGTSGNRGLYLVTDAERYVWLGVILAKALPDALTARHRVAVLLPRNSRLYDAANESGRLVMRFFDLNDGVETHIAALAAFSPTIIVSPPKVLRILAESDVQISPVQVFSGAEVLDPMDRAIIEARFALTVREIYMATEGLLAVACERGVLHAAEDVIAFEWTPGPEGSKLASPLITDFTRRTQMMVRYRMNDLVRLRHEPCACGSALQPLHEVVGRMDDVFEFAPPGAKRVLVTPDVLRNAIVQSNRSITDFRLLQTGPLSVELILPPGPEARLDAARSAMQALLSHLGAPVDIVGRSGVMPLEGARKLRRVERVWGKPA
jgi:putative adenylate-forming enzyme